MQTKQTSLIIVTLVILGVAIFLLQKIKNPEEGQIVDQVQTVASTSTEAYQIKTLSYASSSNVSVVEYIQFEKMNSLNLVLEKEAKEIFAKNIKELESNYVGHTSAGVPMEGREFIINRKVSKDLIFINDTKTIVSIAYENYVDMGGAHGTFFYTSDTFSITDKNKKLALSDVFKDGFQKDMTPYIKDKIIRHPENCIRCELLGGEIDPMVESVIPENFVLGKDSIRFLYSAYDLGAYVATASGQELVIPLTDIQEYVARAW